MEIDDTFSDLEEIEKQLEKEGFVFRISFDEADEDDDVSPTDVETADFAAEADPEKIKKWEAELPDDDDIDDETDNDSDDDFDDETDDKTDDGNDIKKEETEENKTGRNVSQKEVGLKNPDDAEVVYFDLFKKKIYSKTLIFQKEEETGQIIYKLIGFCEAPMG